MATKQKPTVIDTRKTGPLGYRALQYANLLGYKTPTQYLDYLNANTDYSYMPELFSSIEATEDKTYTPSQLGVGEDIGTSHWDLLGYNEDELLNYLDIRANNLSRLVLAANGVIKGAVLAGTTFTSGTVGLLDGIYTAASEGRISGIWDNPVTLAMAEINEAAERELPNYYTKLWQEGPWYDPSNLFTVNTVFDKLIKNLGFMVGAAYSGSVYSKLLSGGAELLGAAKAAGSALKAGAGVTREAMAAGAKAMTESNATRGTKALIGAFMNAEAEGTTEAVNHSNDLVKNKKKYYDDLTAQELQKAQDEYLLTKGTLVTTKEGVAVDPAYIKYQNRIQELRKAREDAYKLIELDRTKMGNADLLFNLPILWMGDLMTFGKMYAGGWKAARNEVKTTTRATKEALLKAKAEVAAGNKNAVKDLESIVSRAKKTGYLGLSKEEQALVEEVVDDGFSITSPFLSIADKIGPKTGATYRAIRQPLKEGNEEMALSAAALAAGTYYEQDVDNIYSASIDPEASKKTLSWISTLGNSIKDTYTDIDKYEEGFIGAITGILGSPTFGKKANSTDLTYLGRGKIIGLTGGVFTDIRDYLKDKEDAALTAAHIEKTLKDPNFKNRYSHLVAQTKLEGDKNRAVIHDDEKAYKDAETASIFEDVMYFKKGNRLDLLERALANTQLFEESDIQEIVNMVSSKRSALNANINLDTNEKNKLLSQLDEASANHELHFGQEATDKAFLVFENMGGASNDSAVDFLNNFLAAQKQSELTIQSLLELISNYDERIKNSLSLEYSPYMKSDGTYMSDEEVKEDILKRAQKVTDIIEDISKALDELDSATGESYTDELLATLTWYKIMMRDWEKRASLMGLGIQEFIKTAVNNPALTNIIKQIEKLLVSKDFSALDKIIFGGLLKSTKNYRVVGLDILSYLLDIANMSLDLIGKNDKKKSGIVLARMLASKDLIKIPVKLIGVNEKTGEAEYEYAEKALGEYLKERLLNIILANDTYTEDLKAPFNRAIEDLARIGESYSEYNRLLKEFRKSPEKVNEAHQKADEKAEKVITNKNAKTIAERFNWDTPIGEIAKTLDENLDDINNMGGLLKFIKSLSKELLDIIKKAQKLREAVASMRDYVDESNLDDNLKNIANSLIDEAIPTADNLTALASSILDNIEETILKAANSILDPDMDERIKDEVIQKSEEQLAELFNNSIKAIADALDKQERLNAADEAREKKILEDLEKKRIPTEKEPTEAPSEEELSVGDSFTLKDTEDAPIYKITKIQFTGKDKKYIVTNSKTGKSQSFDVKYVNSKLGSKYAKITSNKDLPEGVVQPVEEGPQADGKLYEENKKASKSEWKRNNNNKQVGTVKESSTGKERKRQITEYYLHGLDSITYVLYLKEHPSEVPDGVDRNAFIKYIEATYKYLKEHGAYNYISNYLQKGDKITFTIDPELTKEAGVPVVLMTVESRIEKNEDGTPKVQVIGSLRSELDFLAYDTSVLKNSKKKNDSIEALRVLVNKILKAASSDLEVHSSSNETSKQNIKKPSWFDLKDLNEDPKPVASYIITFRNKHPLEEIIPYLYSLNTPQAEALLKELDILIRKDKLGLDGYRDYLLDTQTEKSKDNAALNFVLVTSIITKVESLMAGELPISSNESSLSEIFEGNTPIIGICLNGEIITGKKTVDDNTIKPNAEDGQVYVMVPSHNGKYIPALCYSTPINSLSGGDWYIQEAVKALVNTTSSAANMGAATATFKKWVPLRDLHINFIYIGERDGNTFYNLTDDKGKATHLQIKFKDKEGKQYVRNYRLNNGELLENIARGFIRTWTTALNLTVSIDKNKLNDTEYIKHMASYIYTNLVRGEMGLHTRDDWFTYEPTDVELLYINANTRQSPAVLADTPKGKTPVSVKSIMYKGQEYQVASDGLVSLNGEAILDKTLAQNIKDALNTAIKAASVIDLGSKPTSTSAFAAFASGPSISKLGGRSPRRGSANRGVKNMEESVAKTEEAATLEELLRTVAITKKLFPKLSAPNRVIIVEGMIDSFDEYGDPVKAFGAFKDGILYISDMAPRGTSYHEAFHYITDFLLKDAEKERMFELARKQYGELDELELEEKLAEDFRAYLNGYRKPTLSLLIKMFFRNLANLILGVKSDALYLDTLFYNIARGNLSSRKEHKVATTKNMIETSQQYEARLLSILGKAPRNKEGKLLAPNGKVSNLTERQYAQVRTKEFKNWFGDWESDPENSSRVVDENGEPLVVYHGTDADFTAFNASFNDKSFQGFFFSNSSTMSSTYGKNLIGAFLNIKDPYIVDGNGKNWNNLYVDPSVVAKNLYDAIRIHRNYFQDQLNKGKIDQNTYNYWNNKYYKYLDEYNSLGTSIFDKIKKFIIDKKIESFKNVEGSLFKTTRDVEQYLEKGASDVSIIFNSIKDYGPIYRTTDFIASNVYVVTNPNNVKSAEFNNGEFSTENNNIKYMRADTFKDDVMKHRIQKFSYDNLSSEEKEYLSLRHITEGDYRNLSTAQQEILLHCM